MRNCKFALAEAIGLRVLNPQRELGNKRHFDGFSD
jgi:hypothetical protein